MHGGCRSDVSARLDNPNLQEPCPEVDANDGEGGRPFLAVIDGLVVDATDFVSKHPGGLKKILSANAAGSGATGRAFGFSLSSGRNAHFPETGRIFREAARAYEAGGDGKEMYCRT